MYFISSSRPVGHGQMHRLCSVLSFSSPSVDQGDQVLVCGLRDPRLTGLLDGGGASGLCNWAESRREGDENNKTEDNLCI